MYFLSIKTKKAKNTPGKSSLIAALARRRRSYSDGFFSSCFVF